MKISIQHLLMLFFFGSLFMACNPNMPEVQNEDPKNQTDSSKTEGNQSTDDTEEPISFKIQEYGDEEVGVSYPIMEGGKEEVRSIINERIEKEVFEYIDEGDAENIEAALDAFRKKSENYGGMLSLNVNPSEVYVKETLISFSLNWSDYQGGAHGNSGADGLTFDSQTGKCYTNDELILDEKAFTDLVEQKFRTKMELSETASINSKGHSFEDNKFVLPSCIYYTKEGLELYYVPYEIAPYVMAGTELSVSYVEVKGMIKGVD